jgi:hypothetical protein
VRGNVAAATWKLTGAEMREIDELTRKPE